MIRTKEKAIFEIFLLVMSTFAFAYIIKGVENGQTMIEKRFEIGEMLWSFIRMVFSDKTIVSALEADDVVSTCQKTNDNAPCVEFPAEKCQENCAVNCYPATLDKTPGCKLGTCFDPIIGTCSERVAEFVCERNGGKWSNNIAGNIAECQKACCVIGQEVKPLITRTECEYIKGIGGIETEFRADVRNEFACYDLARTKTEGACVFVNGDEKSCSFMTKGECLSKRGEFFEGVLCTNPSLEMPYEKQATARCVDDKLYWFDSEGNKENVYDALKAKSWNNGIVLSENENCEIGTNSNPLGNQDTCGNCERYLGSICGEKTETEKLSDGSIGFVCRDMRCRDSDGNIRENGESWCEYQGAIGSVEDRDGEFLRSVDTPGSRHFRAICIDGDVDISPCDEYRNKICVEERALRESDNEEISTSSCVVNIWQLCLDYNNDVKGSTKEEKEASLEVRDDKCIENPHCELKKVDIADQFKFNMCVPKYPAGFDLQKNPEGSILSCKYASQKCTVIYVKKIGGWDCAVNCDCEKREFTEKMNDLCMSLGDCGTKVSYIGDLTENYVIKRTKKPGAEYNDEIKDYSEPIEGKYARIENSTKYYSAIRGFESIGTELEDLTPEELEVGGMISGAMGAGMLTAGKFITISGNFLYSNFGITSTAWNAFGGALAGAAIGFAVTSMLIKFTGIGRGLPPAATWALVGTGSTAGGFIGAGLMAQSAASIGFGVFSAVVVVVLTVVFKIIGIGDTKKRIVVFECNPWQPPLGGDKCDECWNDGYGCSKYSCQALGINCRLLNEGDDENQACVNIGEGDILAPEITPWKEALSEGFSFKNENERGVEIVSNENDGCLREYQNLLYGIKTNEYSKCRYNIKHTPNFDDMLDDDGRDFDFGIFMPNHTESIMIPDMTSLGVPGYDPKRRVDFDIYVRCIDGNGNGQDMSEYVIKACVKPGEDTTSPIVKAREPANENVKWNQTELYGTVYLTEPSDCKWSLDSTKSYEEMENLMECENDVLDLNSIYGWTCSADFPIDKEEVTAYIQCKDQPWYGTGWQGEGNDTIAPDENKRNEMPNVYPFVIKRTKTPLEIEYISPNNETFIFGIVPATVTLEVKTKGGIDNTATCYLFEKRTGNEMQITFGTLHQHTFNMIIGRNYKFPVICEDSVGNRAEGISEFRVDVDVSPPKITRIYGQGGSLIVITDEAGECSYSRTGCDFVFDEAEAMSGADLLHSTGLDEGLYYIKCRDKWKTEGGECLTVRGAGF